MEKLPHSGIFLVKGKLDSCKPGACSHEAELKALEGSSSDWMLRPSTHTVGNTAFQVKNTVLFLTPGNTCCCSSLPAGIPSVSVVPGILLVLPCLFLL